MVVLNGKLTVQVTGSMTENCRTFKDDTWPNHRSPCGTPDLAKVGWLKVCSASRGIELDLRAGK
jgi:hypothetical protein